MGKMTAYTGTNVELHELIEAVSKLPNLSFLLEVMLERISKGLGVESAGVMLYDPVSQRLELQSPAYGTTDQNKISRFKLCLEDGGNAVKVFKSGRPYISNNIHSDDPSAQKFIRLFGAKTAMMVPLTVSGKCIGVLHLNNKLKGLFTENDIKAAMGYAHELAILIEQSRSYNQMNEQEKEVRTLYEIGVQILQGTSIEGTLRSILYKISQYMNVDGAGYCLFNSSTGQYEGEIVIGHQVENLCFKEMPASLWKTLMSGQPVNLGLNFLLKKVFHKILKHYELNYGLFVQLQSTYQLQGMVFILKKENFSYGISKIEKLKRFAQQVSLALQNDRLIKGQSQLIKRLEKANYELLYSLQIYSKLLNLVLDGGSFDDLATGIQNLAKRKVYLFDEDFNPLSKINQLSDPLQYWIRTELVPEKPIRNLISNQVDGQNIQIAPSFAGDKVIGYVMMTRDANIEIDLTTYELDHIILEQSAIVYALRKMQQNIEADIEGRIILNWLDDVLLGDLPDHVLIQRGKMLGYTPHSFNQIFLLRLKPISIGSSREELFSKQKNVERLTQYLSRHFSQSFATIRENIIIILYADPKENELKATEERLQLIYREIEELSSHQVQCGVVLDYDGSLADLRRSYQDGVKLLGWLEKSKKRGLLFGSALKGYQFFLRCHNIEEMESFVSETLAPLLRLDQTERNMWLETLKVYLENSCKIKQTADELHVHKNTLLYRLQKLEEMLKMNFKDATVRFNLQLACRLYDLLARF